MSQKKSERLDDLNEEQRWLKEQARIAKLKLTKDDVENKTPLYRHCQECGKRIDELCEKRKLLLGYK